MAGAAGDLRPTSLLDDFPFLDDRYSGTQPFQDPRPMIYGYQRKAELLLPISQSLDQIIDCRAVERGERFVE